MQKQHFRIMAAVIFLLAAFPFFMECESVRGSGVPMGLLPTEEIAIVEEWEEEPPVDGGLSAGDSSFFLAERNADIWSSYSNYYIYNQMTEAERAFWDDMNEMCMAFISTEEDAAYNDSNQVYYLSGVTSDALTLDEMRKVFYLFKFSNPQYYFINNKLVRLNRSGSIYLSPGIYSAFAKGAARTEATERMFTQAESWREQLSLCETKADQVRLAHDLILEKVSYNNRIYQSNFDEDTEFSQSAYSVFCMDTTVCAGYAQAMEMMCNCMDIPAIAVTSETHEWNKVRIQDSWYNVDCTWDDGIKITYAYFERSDLYYDTAGSGSVSSHREEEYWEDYLPACTLDAVFAGTDYTSPGVLPEITERAEAPEIVVTTRLDTAWVSFSCEAEDVIFYYTLDGTTPSCAASKSQKYEESFSVPWGTTVTALAVRDAHLDSDAVGILVKEEKNQDTETPGLPGKGDTVKWQNQTYKVTKAGKNPTVTFVKAKKSITSLVIPAKIKTGGVTYQVTAVAAGACRDYKKLQTVTIGKNVTKIGKNAFCGCKKLSVVKVKTERLSSVGKNALKGISPTAKLKFPAKKMSKYKKLFSVTGAGKKVRYVKLS